MNKRILNWKFGEIQISVFEKALKNNGLFRISFEDKSKVRRFFENIIEKDNLFSYKQVNFIN